mgnify:CR=1 FL=1
MLNRWITKSLSWFGNGIKYDVGRRGVVWGEGERGECNMGGGVSKTGKYMQQRLNQLCWLHRRVENNKTNKAQASRFCSTASHHSSIREMEMFDGGGGGVKLENFMKQKEYPQNPLKNGHTTIR